MAARSFYNREKPLLERKHVPCEFILSPEEMEMSGCRSIASSKRKLCFTLRVLQGHRPIPNSISQTERSIRLELSDEHRKHRQIIGRDKPKKGTFACAVSSPPCFSQKIQNVGPFHFPICQQNNYSTTRDTINDETVLDEMNSQSDASKTISLYELEVGESDFAQLRHDQALLVDFSNFSKSLIELLMSCDLGEDDESSYDFTESKVLQYGNPCYLVNETVLKDDFCGLEQNTRENHFALSKFTCRIEDYSAAQNKKSWDSNKSKRLSARFSIVESNQFRELVHLSLNMNLGTDESVRSYLSLRLKEILGYNAMLKFQLGNERERANANAKELNEIWQQYNKLLSASEKEKHDIAQEADECIQKETERRCEELKLIRKVNEEEIQTLKENMNYQRHQLQSKIDLLENENKRLTNENEEKKSDIISLQRSLDKYGSELESWKMTADNIKNELFAVESERDNLKENLTQSEGKVTRLEASNGDNKVRIDEFKNEIKEATKNVQDAKKEAETNWTQLQALEKEYGTAKDELNRTKDLLNRYQRDRQEMKKRMRSKVEMIKKQEEILVTRDVMSAEMQGKYREKEDACKRLEQELATTKEQWLECKKQLEEKQHELFNKQQVIAWLQRANREKDSSRPSFAHPSPLSDGVNVTRRTHFTMPNINNDNATEKSRCIGSVEYQSPSSISWYNMRQTPVKSSNLTPHSNPLQTITTNSTARTLDDTDSRTHEILEKDHCSTSSLSLPMPRPVPVPTGKIMYPAKSSTHMFFIQINTHCQNQNPSAVSYVACLKLSDLSPLSYPIATLAATHMAVSF